MRSDRETFDRLVREHHGAVFVTARRILCTDADAEDVVQQTFLRVLEGKHEVRGDVRANLCWLAARLAANHVRGARRRRRHEEVDTMRGERPDPTEEAAAGEARRAVQRGLRALPDELRVPLVLRFHEGLTFQRVAEVLRCSESTAHDKVRRGLLRLRESLAGTGFAALGARLDELMPLAAEQPEVPPALEPTLLALPRAVGATAAAASGKAGVTWFTTGLAAVALVTGAIVLGAGPGDTSLPAAVNAGAAALREHGAPVDPDAPPTATRNAVAADPSATEPATAPGEPLRGRIAGRVHDRDTHLPLAGVEVRAWSTEAQRHRKGALFTAGPVLTDAAGAFALDVPIARAPSQRYRVTASLADWSYAVSDVLVVEPDVPAVAALVLRRLARDVPGHWRLDVTVIDGAGHPIPEARVHVERLRPQAGGGDAREAFARTDAAGRATLNGDHHGEKVLYVNAGARELAPALEHFPLTDAGPHARTIVLEPGATLSGIAVDTAGTPLPRLSLRLAATEPGQALDQHWAQTDAAGRFAFRSLRDARYALHFDGGPWSPFTRPDLGPSAEPLVLRLKRFDDPRSNGLHRTELHGRVVDASSGAPLAVLDVDTVWVPDTVTDVRAEVLPDLVHPRPVQRAMANFGGAFDRSPSPDFHLVGLRPGRYLVVARHNERALGWAGPFDLGDADLRADVVVRMAQGGVVRGRVLDAGGRPVEGAVVFVGAVGPRSDERLREAADLLKETGGEQTLLLGGEVRTDRDGAFRFERILCDVPLRALAARSDGTSGASEAFVARDGATTDVVVRLR